MADAGGGGERRLRRLRQPPEDDEQQIDDVLRDVDLLDRGHLPGPGAGGGVEGQQRRLVQEAEHPAEEEGVPGRLSVQERRQRRGPGAVAAEDVPAQLDHGLAGERQQVDAAKRRRAGQDLHRRGDGGPDAGLFRPQRRDDEQAREIRRRGEGLEQPQGGGIGPLEIVQEQHERMLPAGQGAQEGLEHAVHPALVSDRLDRRQRWGRADEPLQLGRQVGDHPGVLSQRVREALPARRRSRRAGRRGRSAASARKASRERGVGRAPALEVELGGSGSGPCGGRSLAAARRARADLPIPAGAREHHYPGLARGRRFPGVEQRASARRSR